MNEIDVHATGEGFWTPGGIPVLLETSHALPMVDFEVAFRAGSFLDPEGLEGLTRMVARMVRMGTGSLGPLAVEERIAGLGARLSVDVTGNSVRFQGAVIRRNLEPFVALLGALITAPAFRAADAAHVKREAIGALVELRDHDDALAARAFRETLLEGHPYGRSIVGSKASIGRIKRVDLIAHHERTYRRGSLLVGAAGAVDAEELARIVDAHLGPIARGRVVKPRIAAPRPVRGRRLVLVDKPERTQTQLYVGSLGAGLHDPQIFPLHVGNVAFGGLFTGRLMHEVRAVRGLSYGASSRMDAHRHAFSIHTFPSATDAVACTELVLELFESFVSKGLTDAEVRDAKRFLVRGHCFEVDTAAKRLDGRMDVALYGIPAEHYTANERLVRAVTPASVREAVKKRLSTRDLVVSIVATRSDLEKSFAALPGLSELRVIPYDR